jgi:phosphohistidine swiveling domain-containing protein
MENDSLVTAVPTAFNKKDWFNHGRWVDPPLCGSFWSAWNSTKSVKQVFPKDTLGQMLFIDGNTLGMVADKHKMLKRLEELDKSQCVEIFAKEIESIAFATKKKHLDTLNKKSSPFEYIEFLFDTYQDMAGIWWLTLWLADELESYLFKSYPSLDRKKVFASVESIRKRTWLEEQSRGIKKIAGMLYGLKHDLKSEDITLDFISQYPEVFNRVKEHVKEFAWFGTHRWSGEGYNLEKCLSELRKVVEEPPKDEEKTVAEEPSSLEKLMATLSFWRTHCAEVTAKVVFLSRPVLKGVAENNGLTYEELTFLTAREILGHLKNGEKLPNKLPERSNKYGHYIDDKGEEHVFVGAELQSLLGQLVRKSRTHLTEVKGSVANAKGTIVGKAKVLITHKDFEKFQEGDILFAAEATPEFVPIMKKAKAVVTDRGGITSHAAIVSRELGVPCIVGAKDATTIFKDGETVEVDSERGLIKKVIDLGQ